MKQCIRKIKKNTKRGPCSRNKPTRKISVEFLFFFYCWFWRISHIVLHLVWPSVCLTDWLPLCVASYPCVSYLLCSFLFHSCLCHIFHLGYLPRGAVLLHLEFTHAPMAHTHNPPAVRWFFLSFLRCSTKFGAFLLVVLSLVCFSWNFLICSCHLVVVVFFVVLSCPCYGPNKKGTL